MKNHVQCIGCGREDSRDLSAFDRDSEGNWWHNECRQAELERQLEYLKRVTELLKAPR